MRLQHRALRGHQRRLGVRGRWRASWRRWRIGWLRELHLLGPRNCRVRIYFLYRHAVMADDLPPARASCQAEGLHATAGLRQAVAVSMSLRCGNLLWGT
ncbi:hypothetical protein ATY46_05665 [Xanthomonas oryzae pv. oryzae]|nr:hypothetical protein ATY46_05665 [Xanthomonas oryzae pv. oryzae]